MGDKINSFIYKNKELPLRSVDFCWSDLEYKFYFTDSSEYPLSCSELSWISQMGITLRWRAKTEEIKCRNQF